jgi:hypothetical protein
MSTRRTVTLLDACHDANLFAPWFKDRASWAAWFSFIAALFALPLTAKQIKVFKQCTGRTLPPTAPATEAWLVCGRRAGKSFMLALVAVFLATFKDHRAHLAPGERGTIMVIAADRKQSRVILRYVRALLTKVPMLAKLIERETAEAFDLSNGVNIEVATASYRSTRGYTTVAILADEIAFWPSDDAAEPDYEILNALRPSMITIPGAMLLCASSPYAQRGALWDAHRKHFGKDGDSVLVWQAPTKTMNPAVPQHVIDAALEADPSAAAAEYLAQFRTDVESYISRDVVDAAIVPGRHELRRTDGARYVAFVDPSGGSSDAMTLAICHREGERVVLDVVRERRPPFSPDDVVNEFSALLKAYGVGTVRGDRYGGLWPRERFAVHGVEYRTADKPKSELYRDLLPTLNSGRVELLDHPRLPAQLCGLERRTARGGRDNIDHAPGAHDDVANAVAGAIVTASRAVDYNEIPGSCRLLSATGRDVRQSPGHHHALGEGFCATSLHARGFRLIAVFETVYCVSAGVIVSQCTGMTAKR